jgi:DNA-binding transcriptional ArsR family regulator
MRDLSTPAHRALHQFGGFHDLRPIDREAWSAGLAERFAADNCPIEQAALARIVDEQTVERIRRLHKRGLVVAERLARGEPVYTRQPRGVVRRALEALRDAAIIESRGRGDWRFSNPLLRRYLAEMGRFE